MKKGREEGREGGREGDRERVREGEVEGEGGREGGKGGRDRDREMEEWADELAYCDHLCINHPLTTTSKFGVHPKITARSMHSHYSFSTIGGVIYGVFTTLCCSVRCRLRMVSPGVTLLLPCTVKECRDTCDSRNRLQCIASVTTTGWNGENSSFELGGSFYVNHTHDYRLF